MINKAGNGFIEKDIDTDIKPLLKATLLSTNPGKKEAFKISNSAPSFPERKQFLTQAFNCDDFCMANLDMYTLGDQKIPGVKVLSDTALSANSEELLKEFQANLKNMQLVKVELQQAVQEFVKKATTFKEALDIK